MPKVKRSVDTNGDIYYKIYCPACTRYHMLDKRWLFNENYDKPTFDSNPPGGARSLLIYGHKIGDYRDGFYTEIEFERRRSYQCHSIITDGKIQYCDDCDHPLKGQTVDLPDLSNYNKGENL